MNLGELRDRLSFLLNFRSGTPDQDFNGPSADTWRRIDDAINAASRKEFSMALSECGAEAFISSFNATWPASQVLFTLPADLDAAHVQAIYDVTNSTRGDPLWVGDRMTDSTLVWRDSKQLEWGTTGPGSAKTLLIQFLNRPTPLQNASDSPDWLPDHYHDILVWSAGIILKKMADSKVPTDWKAERNELRDHLWKHLSASRPRLTGPNTVDQLYYHI